MSISISSEVLGTLSVTVAETTGTLEVAVLATAPAILSVELGTPGPAATVTVGTTTTLSAGSSATVTNVGTSLAAVLNFGIPQGQQGTPASNDKLPLAGGAMDANATITLSTATYDSLVSGEVFGVELTADTSQNAYLEYNKLTVTKSGYYITAEPELLKVFDSVNNLGVSIAHDSIAIQHIDTPNVTGYFTNEYIGFEDLGGSPHSSFIEHDVITVQDGSGMTQMRATGLTFPDSSVQTTAGIPEAPNNGSPYVRQSGAWEQLIIS